MYTYNASQWLAFFFIYCFLGWVWECCYVSFKQKKWVNRGFLHGPVLPIYGSGAVIVLYAALPFRGSVIGVFISGMIAATILEYFTGAAMEAMFKVRYWDYSDKKFNLHGHICLFCSLGWGLFSVAMVYYMHEPFERFVLSIPEVVLDPILYVVVMIFAADFALSFKTAIELRDVLEKLEKAKQEAQIMQRRLEIYEAFLADDVISMKERYSEEIKEELKDIFGMLKETRAELTEFGGETKELIYDQVMKEKKELQNRLSYLRARLSERNYVRPGFVRLLRGNPGAISVKLASVFEEFKELHK